MILLRKRATISLRMNIEERKNLTYRLISFVLILCSLGFTIFALAHLFYKDPSDKTFTAIGLIIVIFFAILELFFLIRHPKKESIMYQIAFNDNGNINNVPLIAVGIGTGLGVVLISLGSVLYFKESDLEVICAMMFVLSVGIYLLINCVVYYLYVFIFKKRPLNLRDLIK